MGWKTDAGKLLAGAIVDYAEGDKGKGDDRDDRQKSRSHNNEREVGKAYRQQRQLEDQKADMRRQSEIDEKRRDQKYDLASREQWRRQVYEDMVNRRGNEREERSYGRR